MAFVQEVARGANASNSSTLVLTLSGITTTAGNHLILFAGNANNGTLTVADSKGNTWQTDVGDGGFTPNGADVAIASCKIAAGKALVNGDTITLTFNHIYYHAALAVEFSGLDPTTWKDKTASAYGTGNTSDSGATATTAADVLLVAVTGIAYGSGPAGFAPEVLSPTWTPLTVVYVPSGYPFALRPMYRVVSAAAAYSAKASWTTSRAHAEAIVSYIQVASGVSGTVAATTPKLTGSTAAVETIPGTVAASLKHANAAVAAKETFPLTGAGTLRHATAAVAAAEAFTGTVAGTLKHLSAAVAATETITPTAAASLGHATAAAVMAETFAATGAATLGKLAAAVAMVEAISATAGATLPKLTGAASAAVGAPAVAGEVAASLPRLAASAVAVEVVPGIAAASLPGLSAAASAVEAIRGSVALTITLPVAAAAGTEGIAGSVSVRVPSLTGAAMQAAVGSGRAPVLEVRSGAPVISGVRPVAPALAVRNAAPVVSVWAAAPEIAVRVVRPQITEVR